MSVALSRWLLLARSLVSERELEVQARYRHVKSEPRLEFSRQAKPASNFLVSSFFFSARRSLDGRRDSAEESKPAGQQRRQRERKNFRGRDQGSSLTGPRLFSVFACSSLGRSRCYGVTIVCLRSIVRSRCVTNKLYGVHSNNNAGNRHS